MSKHLLSLAAGLVLALSLAGLAAAQTTTVTTQTTKTIRLRSGNGAPPCVVIGTANAAARETAPRNPAQLETTRWRQSTRRVRCTSRRSTVRSNQVTASLKANRLTMMFLEIADSPMEGGTLYHAAHGLLIYYSRVYGGEKLGPMNPPVPLPPGSKPPRKG